MIFGRKLFLLFHQESSAGALDLAGDLAVKVGSETGETAGKDLAALGGELLEKIGILEVDGLGGDVEPAARHGTVGAAKVGSALRGLG